MSGNQAPNSGPSLIEAQTVVRDFLEQALPDVRCVHITKVAKPELEGGKWEAEADVWQPNPTVQALRLETQQPVLDQQHYLVRLDNLMNVVAYELAEAMRE
jgi:hypothetical protein